MEGTSKYNINRKPTTEHTKTFKNIKIGEVISVDDLTDSGRIKVFIKGSSTEGGDSNITNFNELPWAFPLLPKFLNVRPKVGESVFVFVFDDVNNKNERLYLGPIISQKHKLYKDDKTSSQTPFNFGMINSNVAISTIPDLVGVFPNENDVYIHGRYNTDIILKDNEILIRGGKFKESKPTKTNPYAITFNNETQGYIQLKNDVVVDDELNLGSVTNIVSNKINLITHQNGSPRFNVLNQHKLISDDELKKILEEARPLPFGDILLEYMKLHRRAFLDHVHNGNGSKPTDLNAEGNKLSVQEFIKRAEILENMLLSKNIKIN